MIYDFFHGLDYLVVRLFSNYKAFYQNSPNVCIQQVWWQKQAPSPILLGNVRFMVVAFFAGRFLNTTIVVHYGFVFGLLFSSAGRLAHCPWL